MNADIFVQNVDVDLLRRQRNWALKQKGKLPQGIVNLLDHMLDVAEGYA
jgi:hypothetical protein